MIKPLEKLVGLLGGQKGLSEALKNPVEPVSQAHVWKWLNTTKDGIPAKYVIRACEAVQFQVTPHELRPDLYPYPDDGLPIDLRKINHNEVGNHFERAA